MESSDTIVGSGRIRNSITKGRLWVMAAFTMGACKVMEPAMVSMAIS